MSSIEQSCLLCGTRSDDVRLALTWWTDDPQPVKVLPRCRDRQACRVRVEAAGEPWPLEDHTRPGVVARLDAEEADDGLPVF